MKKHYDGVFDLKTSVSGFAYSDKEGAGITLAQKDIWTRYTKVPLCGIK